MLGMEEQPDGRNLGPDAHGADNLLDPGCLCVS